MWDKFSELEKKLLNMASRDEFEMKISETFKRDLIDMSSYANENKGFKFLLTVIDTFSKFFICSFSKIKICN